MNQLIYHRVTAEELDKSILGNRFFLLLLHKRNPVIQGEFAETRWIEEEQEAVRNILEESLENIVFLCGRCADHGEQLDFTLPH